MKNIKSTMIGKLVYFFKMELNWKQRTQDAPKAYPVKNNQFGKNKVGIVWQKLNMN